MLPSESVSILQSCQLLSLMKASENSRFLVIQYVDRVCIVEARILLLGVETVSQIKRPITGLNPSRAIRHRDESYSPMMPIIGLP